MRTKHQLIMAVHDPVARKELDQDRRPWYIPPETRYYLLEQYQWTCAICRRTERNSRLHIDHKVPVFLGGKCHLDNLQVLCYSCNLKKGPHILDPASYIRGYPIPIIVEHEYRLRNKVLEKVADEYA